jgi:hypothetical protein
MISRGIDGAIVDWYGPSSFEDRGTKLFMQKAEANPGFKLIVEIEHGAVVWHSCYPDCTATEAVIQLATIVAQTFFSSPSYARTNERPVLMEFGMEVLGQPVDWEAVQAAVPGNPIWIHRNPTGYTKAKSGGAFSWLGNRTMDTYTPGWDGMSYMEYFYKTAAAYPAMQTYGSIYKGFNDTIASWAPPGGRHIDQNCGQTWLRTFDVINRWYSASKPLDALQLVTWNDYEEGTELETGIDNCVKISGSVEGDVLEWRISGQENTLDHYEVFLSTDGRNLAKLGEFPTGNRTLNLGSYALPPAQYTVYIKAVGKPSIRNQMSAAVSYSVKASSASDSSASSSTSSTGDTASGSSSSSGSSSNSAGSLASVGPSLKVSPATLTLGRGKSLAVQVSLAGNGFSGEVGLSCSNLPKGVSCSFNPETVVVGDSPTTATMTVVSRGEVKLSSAGRSSGALFSLSLPGAGLLGMVITGSSRRRRIVFAALAVCVLALAACGGGALAPPAATPKPALSQVGPESGTYSITISATTASMKRSTTATLVVE